MSVVTTSPLSPAERADYWHSLLSDTFIPLDLTLHETDPSPGTIVSRPLGSLQFSEVEAGPQTVSRDRRLIARGGAQFLTVTLQHTGTARLTQDGRQALVTPGTFTCSDAGRPYTREQPDHFRFTAVRVPKSELGVSESDLRAITGTVFNGRHGTSGLVAGHLTRLSRWAAGYDAYTARRLAMTATDLLAVLVRERRGLLHPQSSEATHALLARIKDYALRHIADPALSPERIAAEHHISVRYLHKLFRAEGTTVGRWVRHERLERCRRDLVGREGAADPAVSAVAQRWGFANPSYFSRAFRAAYAVSPREWQAGARSV